eukprot:266522-Rhodomonas_salina.1
MVHKDYAPERMDLRQCSLSSRAVRMARGRICCTALTLPDGKGAAISVYQHQSSRPRQQESILGVLSQLLTFLAGAGFVRVFLISDFNACFPGECLGYSDTNRDMDLTFRDWVSSEGFHTGISRPWWTWHGRGGGKYANLDHILLRDSSSRTISYTLRSRVSGHHDHDHSQLLASLPNNVLPPALERDRLVCHRRLDMRQWRTIHPEWFEYLLSHGPAIASMYPTATQGVLAVWRASYLYAASRIGKASGQYGGQSGSNKTVSRLGRRLR